MSEYIFRLNVFRINYENNFRLLPEGFFFCNFLYQF